ncbi:hypothetical protein RHMOL_Rhmol05G0181500 [Rhododendron molle]|uniref:Uncharacterized protein n=1 Tax=Rhododendron molle TaxID=49168 RepID=A0ACC0NQB8_RHOML|nr:hypothetical protein RHMOL_Rhmol05G0181500 [Rhododendron molle]
MLQLLVPVLALATRRLFVSSFPGFVLRSLGSWTPPHLLFQALKLCFIQRFTYKTKETTLRAISPKTAFYSK